MNWDNVLETYLKRSGEKSTVPDLTLTGATVKQISECEASIGIELPAELRDFYLYSNGLVLEENNPEEPRFIRRIQKLPDYVEFARSSFSDTHNKYSKRYLPFIDWANGDSSGYLLDENGSFKPEIFIFLHEHYEYTCEQDLYDFVHPFSESLVRLFTG